MLTSTLKPNHGLHIVIISTNWQENGKEITFYSKNVISMCTNTARRAQTDTLLKTPVCLSLQAPVVLLVLPAFQSSLFPASSSAVGSDCSGISVTDISYGRLRLLPKNAQLAPPHMSRNMSARGAFPRYDRQTLDGGKNNLERAERRNKKKKTPTLSSWDESRVKRHAGQRVWKAITRPFKYRFGEITSH